MTALKIKWRIWKIDRKVKRYYKTQQKAWINEIKSIARGL